jgi:septum formation protein
VRLVLASASPRRRDLLSRLGLHFDVVPSDVDERPPGEGEDPAEYAVALAREKANAVWQSRPGAVILAADTVVAIGGLILGKPEDADDARRMLRMLRGQGHVVTTGLTVRCGDAEHVGEVTAHVAMRAYTDAQIDSYVSTGEPMDKAGGYAVQGQGGELVAGVRSCFNTVVGLPLCLTSQLLRRCGVAVPVEPEADCAHSR